MRAEFNGLPEIVTLEPSLRNVFLARLPSSNARAPKAANDNWLAWHCPKRVVCTENLSSGVVVVKSAEDGV